jgi:hypothetical protein
MSLGISGDMPFMGSSPTIPSENLMVVELRVLSNLIQSLLGNGTAAVDDLRILRNDQAFELSVQPPVIPGN